MRSNVGRFSYTFFVAAVVVLGIAGYGAYLAYPRLQLPAVDAAGLALLSLSAGVAAFFSPCSFPLLATLLMREAGAEADRRAALIRAVVFAAALSIGVVVFLALTAAVIAAGGRALVEQVTFTSTTGRVIRAILGAFLIMLGLVQLERLRFPFHRVSDLARPLLQTQARIRRHAPAVGYALFGFGYLVAGFG